MNKNIHNKSALILHLKEIVGDRVFYRGREYFTENRVGTMSFAKAEAEMKIKISALIEGSESYQASIIFNLKSERFSFPNCSCPFSLGECKHATALGLKFIEFYQENMRLDPGNRKKLFENLIEKNDQKAPDAARKNEKPREYFASKYYLVLDTQYSPSLEIFENGGSRFNTRAVRPQSILYRELNNLSDFQQKFLMFLDGVKFWQDEAVDWERIFSAAEQLGLKIFVKRGGEIEELKFSEKPKKIKAQIFSRENKDFFWKEEMTQDDVVLKLLGDFSSDDSCIFAGKSTLFRIRKNILETHQLTGDLYQIIWRMLRESINFYNTYKNYHRKDLYNFSWEMNLLDSEILNINKIITDAKSSFDLKTEFTENFEIVSHAKFRPLILVDHDSQKQTLQLWVLADYGFVKIDVAQLVSVSSKHGHTSFNKKYFKNRENYHLEIQDAQINYAPIQQQEELAIFKEFYNSEKLGFSKKLKCVKNSAKQIDDFYKNYWPNILTLGYEIEYLRDKFDFIEEEFRADFKVDFDADNDWLSFDVECFGGDNKVTLQDLRKYLRNKEDFMRISDGRMLKVSNRKELEKFILMLESFHEKEKGKFEGKIYHAAQLNDIFSSSPYYNTQLAEGFTQFISEAHSGRVMEKVAAPEKINKILRHYQREGLNWFYFLRKYRFAGILADDMGLGKTLQALTLANMTMMPGKPSIVICPKTLLFNWQEEANKFFPEMKTLIVEGNPKGRKEKISSLKNYDLVITSYSAIKKDYEVYEKQQLIFNYCFLDEAQFVKNHKTQNAQTVKKIRADYRIALTGTPLENSVSEIWSIFDFLMPGFLGRHATFVKKYQTPIMKQSDGEMLSELGKRIECFMLRRTKAEVLKELPAKIEQVVYCEMEDEQNILYQEILASVRNDISKVVEEKGFAKSQIHILAGLTKLRQVCNHPVLLLKDKDYAKYASAKLNVFEELVSEIVSSGRKVLVFSQFTQMLGILEEVLKKNNIDYAYLSGKTNNRGQLVNEFNASDKKKVFLISLKAGGTGLNLTSADNVIIFDPWWNPSVENQAIDRTHRIGQKKSVNVYRFISRGTIEEKILNLQAKKKVLFDNLIGENSELFKKLTWDDVRGLFE